MRTITHLIRRSRRLAARAGMAVWPAGSDGSIVNVPGYCLGYDDGSTCWGIPFPSTSYGGSMGVRAAISASQPSGMISPAGWWRSPIRCKFSSFNASAQGTLCVFSCSTSFNIINPPIAIGEQQGRIFPTVANGEKFALGCLPGTFGICGFTQVPTINTTSFLASDGKTLMANGSEEFLSLERDAIDTLSEALGDPVPTSLSLDNIVPGVSAGYTTWDAGVQISANATQQVSFTPKPQLTLDLGQTVPYQIVDPAGNIVASGTDSRVTFDAGDSLQLMGTSDLNVTPTASLANTSPMPWVAAKRARSMSKLRRTMPAPRASATVLGPCSTWSSQPPSAPKPWS